MDAPCKIQGSIHVFRLVNNMCPGKWVNIRTQLLMIWLQLFREKWEGTIYNYGHSRS